MKTQKDLIESLLLKNGIISRNYCLRNYISRLSAHILQLEKEGYKFERFYGKQKGFKKENHKNYYYQVISKPEKKLL